VIAASVNRRRFGLLDQASDATNRLESSTFLMPAFLF